MIPPLESLFSVPGDIKRDRSNHDCYPFLSSNDKVIYSSSYTIVFLLGKSDTIFQNKKK